MRQNVYMKKNFIFFLLMIASAQVKAQSTDLQLGSAEFHLLNRIETCSGAFSNQLFLDNPAVDRRDVYNYLNQAKSDFLFSYRSNVDNYNINRALSLSGEYAFNADDAIDSKHPVFNTFYQKQTDLFRFNKNDFFLSINPVLGFNSTFDKNANSFLANTTAGFELNSNLKKRVGLYFFLTHNYEEPLAYQQTWINKWQSIPGAGEYQRSGKGYQYLKIRGYAKVAVLKDYVALKLGYDQNFIGDGIRSLFLSDFSEGAWFASLETKIWKLNYRNIYLRLEPQRFLGEPLIQDNKYATVHHLSVNVRPWLNIGLFEAVTFLRNGTYEIGYLNPIIFYRAIERSMGSPDKVSIGLDAKAIAFKRLNIYSQFLINEFTSKEFFSNKGYWANKWALQLGLKYYNAFTIKNLDIQAEMNLVRPYTYSHSVRPPSQSVANFTHYNQALAHPLGAGFRELIGTIHYQPSPRLSIDLQAMYYQQGVDTGSANFGNNIFKDYKTRSNQYGVNMVSGPKGDCFMANLNIAYELKPRLYLELGGGIRNYSNELTYLNQKDIFLNAGFRLNLNKSYRYF